MIYKTKCACGCGEKHFKIGFNKFYIFYVEDCGEWWFQVKLINTLYSYSPCQGIRRYKGTR